MMRATGAKLRMLASEAAALGFVWREVDCGGEVEECGDEDDMALCRAAGAQVHGSAEWLAAIARRSRIDAASQARARDWRECRHPGAMRRRAGGRAAGAQIKQRQLC
jgi:hypothetical protein